MDRVSLRSYLQMINLLNNISQDHFLTTPDRNIAILLCVGIPK